MHQKPDKQTIQQAIRLANTPAGQKIMELLQNSSSDTVDKAKQHAANGDFQQAKDALSQVLQSEELQKLLREMRMGHE